jgi:hypothetical protein
MPSSSPRCAISTPQHAKSKVGYCAKFCLLRGRSSPAQSQWCDQPSAGMPRSRCSFGYWLGWSGSPGKGRAVGVGEVELRGGITPDTKRVRYEVSMRQVRRGKLAVAIANGRVFADDVCVFLAKDLRVGLIAAPG